MVLRLATLMLALVASSGCRAPAENRYSPLDAGRTWKYRLTSRFGAAGEAVIEATNLPPRRVGWTFRSVTPQRIDANGQQHLLFYGLDHQGVYFYGVQSPASADPKLESSPQYAIMYPVEKGKTWEDESWTTFLPKPVRVKLKSQIAGTDEVVRVRAGEFKNCLRVRSEGSTRIPIPQSYSRFVIVVVNYDTWYAPGVGMVKSESDEWNNGGDFARAQITTELESYTN